MAIEIHWIDHIIHVPKDYLTLDSGTLYILDTDLFRLDLKGLEASVYGICNPKTHNHNTEITVAGTTYARAIEILSPYTVEFEDGQYTVILIGSNNNIFDVAGGILVQNQVQVIPTNAAGLIVKEVGSAVTEQDKADIIEGVWDELLTGATHNIPTSSGRRLRQLGDIIAATVVDPAATTTSFITDLAESRDDFYVDQLVRFTTGNLEGHVRVIASYEGATNTITVAEAMVEAPDDGIGFDIIPTHVHPISEIADGVWEKELP